MLGAFRSFRQFGIRSMSSAPSLQEIAQQLKKDCNFMWKVLEDSQANNWYGILHCRQYLENNQYDKAADALLSMYGGMGSFTDWYCTNDAMKEFDEARDRAYRLAKKLQQNMETKGRT